MAIPTYVHSGTKGGVANIGNVPNAPASWQADDILLLTVEGNVTASHSLSDAQGFTAVTGTPVVAALQTSLAVYWKRATSGSDTMPTIAPTGNHSGAQMHVFRGCKTSGDPWNVIDTGIAGSSTSWATDGVTTTVADCLIVEIVANGFDIASVQSSGEANANLANLTEQWDSWMSSGDGGGFVGVTGEKASAGATGSTTGTFANAGNKAYITIAFEPPGGASPQNVSPGALALTLTPEAPTLTQEQEVFPGAIALSATPLQPTIGQRVTPAANPLTLTPVAPIAAQSNLSPGALALTLTPVAPVPVQTNLSPGANALTLTPVAPTVTQRVTPGAATLTVTAVAPVVTQKVSPSPVALTLTAVAPAVTQRVVVNAFELTLTPAAPLVSQAGAGQNVTPAAIPLSVSAVAPVVTQRVVVGAVSLTLTPVAPATTQPQTLAPAAIALTLSRPAPTISGVSGPGGLNDEPTPTVRIGATWWDPLNVDPTKAAGRVHDVQYAGGYFYFATEGADRVKNLAGTTFTCNSLFRVNATTMNLDTSWFPTFNLPATGMELHSIATDGTTVWVAGNFTSMTLSGTVYTRSKIIAIDGATGIPTSWSSGTINDTVRGIVYDDGFLYFVGQFTSVTATTRNRAAAISATTGALQSWNPALGTRANDIDVFTATGGTKYLAIAMNGNGTVNGAGSYNFTLVEAIGESSPGTAAWSKNEGSGGGHVCAASDAKQRLFYGTKGSGGNKVWCYNASGTKQWSGSEIDTNGDIQALAVYQGRHTEDLLYVGTHDTSFSSTPGGSPTANVGSGFARFDIDTGAFDSSYFPEFKQDGSATDPYDGHTLKLWRIRGFEDLDMLAVGGDFQRVDTANGRFIPDPVRIAFFSETGGGGGPGTQSVSVGTIGLSVVFPGTGWGGQWGNDSWDAGLTITQGSPPGGQTVSPPPIAISISPVAPTFAKGALVRPGAVGLTLTPQAPIVNGGSLAQALAPARITLTLTPQAPDFLFEPTPSAIALTLTVEIPAITETTSGFGPSFGKPPDPVFHGFVPVGRRLLFTRPK